MKRQFSILLHILFLLALSACGLVPANQATMPGPTAITQPTRLPDPETWERFEARLEYLRQQMKIPGLSAAVVMDQKLVWAKGFGYADLENRIEVTPDTPFPLASVTKTVAAVLIMQLVQEKAISLDDPISKYGVELPSQGTILVRHLLMHASTGVPGTTYIYDGARYGCLDQIAERATGKSFGALMQERILSPLGMTNTWMDKTCGQDISTVQVAKPYQLDPSYNAIAGIYRKRGFTAAAGLISTVKDLAKFDIALDQNVLLHKETKEKMLAPAVAMVPGRPDLSHGLGWFSTEFMGTRLNWHAGRMPPSASANIIKVPEQNLTFIILANTDHLNVPPPHPDIAYSTPCLAFYETFVYPRQSGKTVPEVNWEADEKALVDQLNKMRDSDLRKILERELWAYRQLFASMGKTDLMDRLLRVHQQVYPDYPPTDLDMYTYQGRVGGFSPAVSDQVHLTAAELERFAGEYTLSDQTSNTSLPLEASLQVINGKLVVSSTMGCFDLVSITSTRFTTPERQFYVSISMNGEAVERVTISASGIEAVYIPKE